jgi:hypothetical protein
MLHLEDGCRRGREEEKRRRGEAKTFTAFTQCSEGNANLISFPLFSPSPFLLFSSSPTP